MRQQIIMTESLWLKSLGRHRISNPERYQNGLNGSNALADLETARSNSALIRASLAARKQEQRNALRHLSALQGKSGTVALTMPQQVPQIANPPAQLPASVVINRPDVKSAIEKINAADVGSSQS